VVECPEDAQQEYGFHDEEAMPVGAVDLLVRLKWKKGGICLEKEENTCPPPVAGLSRS
jgi:hypothetical protein